MMGDARRGREDERTRRSLMRDWERAKGRGREEGRGMVVGFERFGCVE